MTETNETPKPTDETAETPTEVPAAEVVSNPAALNDAPPPADTAPLDTAPPAPEQPSVATDGDRLTVLYGMSEKLKESLGPVEPSTQFRVELREQLHQNVSETQRIIRREKFKRNIQIGALSAGCMGLIGFILGMLLLAFQLTRLVIGRVFGPKKPTPQS